MNTKAVCLTLLALSAVQARAGDEEFFQDQKHFEIAVLPHKIDLGDGNVMIETSWSPAYVYVTIVDNNTMRRISGCTLGDYLVWAVHDERDLGYSEEANQHVQDIVFANKSHIFHFSKPKALRAVGMNSYTPDDLGRARDYLRKYGVSEFLKSDTEQMSAHGAFNLNRHALACAIVQLGYTARSAHRYLYTYAEP